MRSTCAILAVFALAACNAAEQSEQPPAEAANAASAQVLFGPGVVGSFEVRPGNTVVPSGTDVIIRSNVRGNQPDGDGNVAYLRAPDGFRTAITGRTVTVTVTSRATPEGSPAAFYVAYSRPGVGSSGWRELRITPDFAEQSFSYDVPTQASAAASNDLVLIYADVEGKGRGVEIRKVSVSAAGEK